MSEGSGGGSTFSWGLTPAVPNDAAHTPAEPPVAPGALVPTPAGGALDALFGGVRFQEDEEAPVPAQGLLGRRPAPNGTRAAPRPAAVSKAQKTLISVGGGLVAILALVALFLLGTKLPTLFPAKPVAATSSPTPTRTATPTPTVAPIGPVVAGVHGWNQLLGGECLASYTSPWVEKFTVVDCAVAHPAQMVFRGTFDHTTTPTFRGTEALQMQIPLLCTVPGVLDLAAAGQYADAQVQGSYPVTEAEWTAGQHDYFCFVSRSSGKSLTGSVAVAKASAP